MMVYTALDQTPVPVWMCEDVAQFAGLAHPPAARLGRILFDLRVYRVKHNEEKGTLEVVFLDESVRMINREGDPTLTKTESRARRALWAIAIRKLGPDLHDEVRRTKGGLAAILRASGLDQAPEVRDLLAEVSTFPTGTAIWGDQATAVQVVAMVLQGLGLWTPTEYQAPGAATDSAPAADPEGV
jgi:hypothetical protein